MFVDEIRNIKSSKRDLRKFGFTIGIALIILGGIVFMGDSRLYPYFLSGGIGFIALALVFPITLKPFQKIWMTFSIIMNWFMTRMILSLLFYFVFTPIGLIAKLFGKQFLDQKIDIYGKSYWNYRNKEEFNKDGYKKQF